MSNVEHEGVPQWKSWYRWPFLAIAMAGALMTVIGVRECLSLWTAIRAGSPDIIVETAMSAFPPLGIGFIALGTLAFFPREQDGTGIRPVRTRDGREFNPAKIATIILLAGLLLYPVCGVVLHVATTDLLTKRGYKVVTSQVSHTSGYVTTEWQRTR